VRRGAALILAIALAAAAGACKRAEPGGLDPVRAIRGRLEPRFRTPADGRLTDAQIETYLRVRRAVRGTASEEAAAHALGVDPAEVDWVRGRIIEAFSLLDSRRVAESGTEAYTRAIASLRQARATAGDPRTAAKLDAEIAGAERERAALKRPDPAPRAAAANAARLAPRRAEIEALGP
jgi:hypothetical protein